MVTVTYRSLVMRYGEPGAYDLLLRAERYAKSDYVQLDEEERLERAFGILNKNTKASSND